MYFRCQGLFLRAIDEIRLRPTVDQRFVSQFLAAHRKTQLTDGSAAVLTDEDVQRLSISTQSPENFFNKKKGINDPSWVVATEDEKLFSPTRFGDWEKNGRCMDF